MAPASVQEAVSLATAIRDIDPLRISVGVAPAAVALTRVSEVLRGSMVLVYAQDVHWEERGAFTGQTSALMLRQFAQGSIVGHSEVRRDQGDDDARVARKAEALLHHGMKAIYCLGETLDERRAGRTWEVLARQVHEGIDRIDRVLLADAVAHTAQFVIAYEPVWAIGTGVPATGDQAAEAIASVREELAGLGLASDAITVLYGGSVSASNVAEFARADGVDGALVGGASLKPDEFRAIVAAFS